MAFGTESHDIWVLEPSWLNARDLVSKVVGEVVPPRRARVAKADVGLGIHSVDQARDGAKHLHLSRRSKPQALYILDPKYGPQVSALTVFFLVHVG